MLKIYVTNHNAIGHIFKYKDLMIESDAATGETLGEITRVDSYPAHKVYTVRGAREYLIPAVPGVFIASIDPEAEIIRVHMMKGLATDEN